MQDADLFSTYTAADVQWDCVAVSVVSCAESPSPHRLLCSETAGCSKCVLNLMFNSIGSSEHSWWDARAAGSDRTHLCWMRTDAQPDQHSFSTRLSVIHADEQQLQHFSGTFALFSEHWVWWYITYFVWNIIIHNHSVTSICLLFQSNYFFNDKVHYHNDLTDCFKYTMYYYNAIYLFVCFSMHLIIWKYLLWCSATLVSFRWLQFILIFWIFFSILFLFQF